MDEEYSTDQPQPDYTVITAPFTTPDLIAEQKKDPALQSMFDAAAGPLPTEFVIKNDILYVVNLDQTDRKNHTRLLYQRPYKVKYLT